MEVNPAWIYLQHPQGSQCSKDDPMRGNVLGATATAKFPDDCAVGVRAGQDLYGPEVQNQF